jgi:hypothetical protein
VVLCQLVDPASATVWPVATQIRAGAVIAG